MPFTVDVLDWHRISREFREYIEKQYETIQMPHDVMDIPDGWTFQKVSEIADVIGGGTPKTKEPEYWGGDIPWLTPKDLSDEHPRYISCGERNISKAGLKNSSARILPPKTVLLTSRAPVGYVALAKNAITTNQGFRNLVVHKEHDPEFVYYILLHNTNYLKQHAAGSTFQELSGSTLKSLEFLMPSLPEQRAIAHILGSLDDKIELNRRMNKTLEAMAMAIFKSWFVDFDPVRAKAEGRDLGLPGEIAALFPDSFQDSKLGKIPKGWRFEQIMDRASTVQYGFTQSASAELIGPKFLRITDIRGGSVDWNVVPYCAATDDEREKYKIKKGDILVARTGASTGENYYVVDPPDAVFASYLVRFQFEEPGDARIVGAFMRTRSYFEYVAGCVGGSAQPNASAKVLAGAKLVFPPNELLRVFYDFVQPLDQARAFRLRQNATLASLRDSLLPKLISGKLRVPDAKKFVGEAGA